MNPVEGGSHYYLQSLVELIHISQALVDPTANVCFYHVVEIIRFDSWLITPQ